MNISLESEPQNSLLGVLFFLILIFLCRLLLFNLCVAVVTTTFHRVRKDVADTLKAFRVHSFKLDSGTGQDGGKGAKESIHSSPLQASLPESRSPDSIRRIKSAGATKQLTFHDIVVSVVAHPLFDLIAMSAISANISSMALQHANVPEERERFLQSIQLGTEILFVMVQNRTSAPRHILLICADSLQ